MSAQPASPVVPAAATRERRGAATPARTIEPGVPRKVYGQSDG